MNIYNRRIFNILVTMLLTLISCNPTNINTGVLETPTMMPSPTVLPYWDLLPIEYEPIGGWVFQKIEDANIAFEYPGKYQSGDCGEIFTEYKVTEFYQGLLIGFTGSTIRIHIYDEWESDLEETAKGNPPKDVELVTSVEHFLIGGKPSVRYITKIPDSKTLDYVKVAITYYDDRIYVFSCANLTYLSSCEAQPLTEEQVYEYMISTIEFLE